MNLKKGRIRKVFAVLTTHILVEAFNGLAQSNLANDSKGFGVCLDECAQLGKLLANIAPSDIEFLELDIS